MRSLAIFQAEYEEAVAQDRAGFVAMVGGLDLPGADRWKSITWPPMSAALPPNPVRWKACRSSGEVFTVGVVQKPSGSHLVARDASGVTVAARADSAFPASERSLCALLRSLGKLSVAQNVPIRVRLHYGLRAWASRVQGLLDGEPKPFSQCDWRGNADAQRAIGHAWLSLPNMMSASGRSTVRATTWLASTSVRRSARQRRWSTSGKHSCAITVRLRSGRTPLCMNRAGATLQSSATASAIS
jgi:hypothetical protein